MAARALRRATPRQWRAVPRRGHRSTSKQLDPKTRLPLTEAQLAAAAGVASPPLPSPPDAELDRLDASASRVHSRKWERFGPGAIPLWVADMDFRTPAAVQSAVVAVAQHGIYGYSDPSAQLEAATVARLEGLYGFGELEPAALRWLPGLLPGLNHAVRARARLDELDVRAGEAKAGMKPMAVATAAPIYAPFLAAAPNSACATLQVALSRERSADGSWRYGLDEAALEGTLEREECRVLLWCAPMSMLLLLLLLLLVLALPVLLPPLLLTALLQVQPAQPDRAGVVA